MSTYLACFIISDFVSTSKMAKGLNGREFPISVYTTRLQSKQKRNFAVDIGVKAIEYYINLFKIDYPLPKLGKYATIIYEKRFIEIKLNIYVHITLLIYLLYRYGWYS